jgi:hypothetical protein
MLRTYVGYTKKIQQKQKLKIGWIGGAEWVEKEEEDLA